jgi:hypothetical protein
LITLALRRGLIAVLLRTLRRLRLFLLGVLALLTLVSLVLRRLACGLVFLARLTLSALLWLTLPLLSALGLTRLRRLPVCTGLLRTTRASSRRTLALRGAALSTAGLATAGRRLR